MNDSLLVKAKKLKNAEIHIRKASSPKPFVKWAGGKGQLLSQLESLLPDDFATRQDIVYVEPFVGGGAMLFHVLSRYPNIKRAIVNDLNRDLIVCYKIIRDAPMRLVSMLHSLQIQYHKCNDEESKKDMYINKRSRYNSRQADELETAALFIFLNHTCFNGLYRVNSTGQYNVAFGKAVSPRICDGITILADNRILQRVELHHGDFEEITKTAERNHFFFLDPPYRPLTQSAAFTAYSKEGFGESDQKRLAALCRRLATVGCRWLLTNSDPHNVDVSDMFFERLYSGFDIHRIYASRMINSNGSGRGKITELAIRNYGMEST